MNKIYAGLFVLFAIAAIILIVCLLAKKKPSGTRDPNATHLVSSLESFMKASKDLKNKMVSLPPAPVGHGDTCFNLSSKDFEQAMISIYSTAGTIYDTYNSLISKCKSTDRSKCFTDYSYPELGGKTLLQSIDDYVSVLATYGTTFTKDEMGHLQIKDGFHRTYITINGHEIPYILSGSKDAKIYSCSDSCMAYNADYPGGDQSKNPADGVWDPATSTCSCASGYYPDSTPDGFITCKVTSSNTKLVQALTNFNNLGPIPMITPKFSGACGAGAWGDIMSKDC